MTSSRWPVWCELVCCKCASTCAGQFNFKTLNKVAMKNEAQRQGWKLIANDWLCGECIAKVRHN